MALPLAPDLSISAIPQGKPRDTVNLTLTLSGGHYSRLEYEWYEDLNNDLFVLGNLFSASRHVQNPEWTRPLVHHDGFITVGCRVTAYGTGADNDQSVQNLATENAYVIYVPPIVVPSIRVHSIPAGRERTKLTLTTDVGSQRPGNFDVINYRWQLFTGDFYDVDSTEGHFDDPTHHAPRFTRPDVGFTRDVIVRCTITCEGRNIFAVKGPSESLYNQVQCQIQDIPNAQAPNLTRIQHNYGNPDDESQWQNSAGSQQARQTAHLRVLVNLNTGHYDHLHYKWEWKWHSEDENSWNTIGSVGPDRKNIDWVRPDTPTRQQYDIRCTALVSGIDINAAIDTTDSASIISAETALFINPIDSATAARSVNIQRIEDGGVDWGPFGIPDGLEGSDLGLRVLADLTGAHYDTVNYEWQVTDHNGDDITSQVLSVSDRDVTRLTRPQVVGGNRQIHVKATCVTRGNNTTYLDGSEARKETTVTTTVINHPLADCPNVYRSIIGDQHGFLSGQPVQYHCIVGDRHPGLYDRLTFRWQFSFDLNYATERTDVWDDRFSQNPILTRPSVNVPTTCYIAVTVTAHGDGVLADDGSTDSDNFADAEIVNPLPVAAHPVLTIQPIVDGPSGRKVQFEAAVTDGTYDTLTYEWAYSTDGSAWRAILGDGSIVHWTRPDVLADTTYHVRVRVDANGTGSVAREATHDQSAWVSATFTVQPRQETPPSHFAVSETDGTVRAISHVPVVDPLGRLREINRLVIITTDGTQREIFGGN